MADNTINIESNGGNAGGTGGPTVGPEIPVTPGGGSGGSVDVGGVTIQCNMPNVQNANDLLHELTTNKDIEKAICAMTIGRAMGGSSLAKYKYKK